MAFKTVAEVTGNISQELTAVLVFIKIGNLERHDRLQAKGRWHLKPS